MRRDVSTSTCRAALLTLPVVLGIDCGDGDNDGRSGADGTGGTGGDQSGITSPSFFDLVLALENDGDNNDSYNIYARVLTPSVAQCVADTRVSPYVTGRQTRPDVARVGNGDFVIVWQDDQQDDGFHNIWVRGFTAIGEQLFAAMTMNPNPAGNQVFPIGATAL